MNSKKKTINYLKKNKILYVIIKNIYQFLFSNKLLGKLFWLKARYLHSSKNILYEPCLCGHSKYSIYLNYNKNKVLECTNCNLWRNFPKPDNGIYEKEMAVAYDNNPEVSTQTKEIFTQFKKYFPLSMNILDFGCGDGRALAFAKKLGFKNIYGIEISNHLLKKARTLEVTIFDSVDKIPTDLKFDTVIADNVFEHVLDLDKVLNDIKKLMSDNSVLIAFVPNIRAKKMHSGYFDLLWNTHYWQFNPKTFPEIFKRNGFNVVECKTLTENANKILQISNPNIKGKENGCVFVIAKKL
ncbi:MAG: class I SAM-dependent methyltransferase [bacterium]